MSCPIFSTCVETLRDVTMFLRMALVRMSSARQCWKLDSYCELVSNVVPRNRFQQLLTLLHFVNNNTVSDDAKKDQFWKVRSWLTGIRKQCLKITPEEHCSIDVMMCQDRGQTNFVRHYIKSKPHSWGFKV